MKMEYRSIRELDPVDSSEQLRFTGYAAVFNSECELPAGAARNRNPIKEIILPGAFTRTLADNPDIYALVGHDTSKVLGRTKYGTLRVVQDTRGLKVEIDPPNNTLGWDSAESIRRGDIDAMSIGFNVRAQRWDRSSSIPLRIIEDMTVHEVSITAFPAYTDTSIALRSLTEDSQEDAADWMRRTRVELLRHT